MEPEQDPDDDRTRMPERRLGFDGLVAPVVESDRSQNALPPGTRLAEEFEILEVVGEGGFSIVYLAHDHSLDRRVAIKEYMPSSLAARRGDMTVAAKSGRYAETFEVGRRSFIKEARLLARFDHPSLLKVYRYWEANGTAYMAMPFYKAITFKQWLADRGGPPDEQWLKRFLAQLVDAVDVLHRTECLHRDIAPDNILVLPGDQPLLLDFGAARRVIGDMNQALTVIVKPGYAPIEQYGEGPSMTQGPWTDLYALAGVVYFAISGNAPTPCVARMSTDPLVPLSRLAAGRYSESFLNAIDRALAVQPKDRPQSLAEFRDLLDLDGGASANRQREREALEVHNEHSLFDDDAVAANRWQRRMLVALSAVVLLALIGGSVAYFLIIDRPSGRIASNAATDAVAPAQVPATAPSPVEAETRSAEPSRAPEPAKPEFIPAPKAPANKPLPEPSAAAPAQRAAADPLQILKQVYDARDPRTIVDVKVDNPQVSIKRRESLRWSITSSRPGYMYVLYVGTGRDFLLIFPNAKDTRNFLSANDEVRLPRPQWEVQAEGPAGTDNFVVIVSESPRDFTSLPGRRIGSFKQLLPDAGESSQAAGRASPYTGTVKCASKGDGECSQAYGSAMFAIEEVDGQ